MSVTGDVENLGEHLSRLNDSVMMELYGELKNTSQQSISHELTRVYHLLQLANQGNEQGPVPKRLETCLASMNTNTVSENYQYWYYGWRKQFSRN